MNGACGFFGYIGESFDQDQKRPRKSMRILLRASREEPNGACVHENYDVDNTKSPRA